MHIKARPLFKTAPLKHLLGIFVLLLFVAACSQSEEPHQNKPAMWKVESGGAAIYFLGSLHLLPPDLDWKDERYAQAMADADVVALEVDIKEVLLKGIRGSVAALEQKPDPDMLLTNTLSTETYQRLRAAAAANGLRVALLDQLDAHTAAELLTLHVMINQGFSLSWGLDYVAAADAEAAGKQMVALETFDDQMAALESMKTVEPNQYVNDTLDTLDENPAYFTDMLAEWAAGKPDGSLEGMIVDLKAYPAVYEALIVERNRNWVELMDTWLKAGNQTFFVVAGAGHFVGPDSVQNMLRANGYVVERF